MSELRLAGNQIHQNGVPTPFGHFQIVYVDNNNKQWEIEVTGPKIPQLTWNYSDPPYWNHIANTLEYEEKDSPEYGEKYKWVKILEGQSADNAWDILKDVHKEFSEKGQNIPYIFDTLNSNSYATTLLNIIGIDIDKYADGAKPETVGSGLLTRQFPFPGQGRDVLKEFTYAISLDIQGTDKGDIIHGGVKDDSLSGLGGDDALSGGGGNNKLFGGAGDDILSGGPDNDTLNGGPDNDIMLGGFGNDRFEFSTGDDRIKDFDYKEDNLWVPQGTSGKLDDNFDTVLTYPGGTLTLAGVDLTHEIGPEAEIEKQYPWLDWTDPPLIA